MSTHFSFIKVPPQKILTNDADREYESPTCHPTSPLAAFSPPTTLGAYLFMLNVLRPQIHLKNTHIYLHFGQCFILEITYLVAFPPPPPEEVVGLIVVDGASTIRRNKNMNELMFTLPLLLME